MNKHTRLIVSLLFIGMIVLAVAITRFYSRTEKSVDSNGSQKIIEKTMKGDEYGNCPFQNSDGLVGIVDSSEHIIVSPEWQSIRLIGAKDRCIASKRLRGRELTGCIDFDGNVIVPFVYSTIDVKSTPERILCFAHSADNKSTVVYNSNFDPCFTRTWDSCEYENGKLCVSSANGTYKYTVRSSDLVFSSADLKGTAQNNEYTIKVDASSLDKASALTVPMMEKICTNVGKYIEYAYADSDSSARKLLTDIDKAPDSTFRRLFHDDKTITVRKLFGLTDVIVSSAGTVNGIPHYEAKFEADTGIVYRDPDNKPKRLRLKYDIVVGFTGSSDKDFKAVSGTFSKAEPENVQTEQTAVSPETEPQGN